MACALKSNKIRCLCIYFCFEIYQINLNGSVHHLGVVKKTIFIFQKEVKRLIYILKNFMRQFWL